MASEFRIDGNLITGRVRLNGDPQQGVIGLPSAAWQGESAVAGVIIEDPDSSLDLRGLHTVTWDETACVGSERIFTGWLTGKRVRRGKERGLATGAGRVWDCDVTDQNWIFHLETFRSSSAKRPEESDVERIQWAIASQVFGGTPIYDNGRLSTANPTNMGPADFVTQYATSLFGGTAGSIGKNYYAYWDDDEDEISLHYDLVGNNPASTLSISNDMADVLADPTTVFYPFSDAEADLNPAPLVNGILFGYLGGNYVYTEDVGRFGPNEFSPDNFQRDEVYTTTRVGKLATANALAAFMLADRALEQDTIKCMIRLPNTAVNLLHAGMKVNAKFLHIDGYTTGTDVAVVRRNVIPTAGRRDMYDVHLELSNKTSTVGPGGGDPGDSPYDPTCSTPTLVQSKFTTTTDWSVASITLDDAPTPGNLLVMSSVFRGVVADPEPAGWTPHPAGVAQPNSTTGMMWYRTAEVGESAVIVIPWPSANNGSVSVSEWTGIGELVDTGSQTGTISANGDPMNGGAVTPTPGRPSVVFGMVVLDSNSDADSYVLGAGTGWTTTGYYGGAPSGQRNMHWAGRQVIASPSGDYNPQCSVTGGGVVVPTEAWQGRSLAFSCEDPAPGALQIVRNEFVADGDGTTTTFNTNFPYVPGSLRVFVDGVQVINGLTETDPDTGEFSLDFAPAAASGDTRAEIVTATYQAGAGA